MCRYSFVKHLTNFIVLYMQKVFTKMVPAKTYTKKSRLRLKFPITKIRFPWPFYTILRYKLSANNDILNYDNEEHIFFLKL